MCYFYNKILPMILVAFFITGCASAVNITPLPTGGSKADGTVNLSYTHTWLQTPVIDWEAADSEALDRCKAWGYKGAEAFGGKTNQCQYYNGYGDCRAWTVTVPYQCTN